MLWFELHIYAEKYEEIRAFSVFCLSLSTNSWDCQYAVKGVVFLTRCVNLFLYFPVYPQLLSESLPLRLK